MQFDSISKVIASPSITISKLFSKTSLENFYHVLHNIPDDNVEHGNIQIVSKSDYQDDFRFSHVIPQYHYMIRSNQSVRGVTFWCHDLNVNRSTS